MRENLVVIPLNSDDPIDSEMRQALEAVNLVKGKKIWDHKWYQAQIYLKGGYSVALTKVSLEGYFTILVIVAL